MSDPEVTSFYEATEPERRRTVLCALVQGCNFVIVSFYARGIHFYDTLAPNNNAGSKDRQDAQARNAESNSDRR